MSAIYFRDLLQVVVADEQSCKDCDTLPGRWFSRRSAGEVDDGQCHGQLVLAGFRRRQTARTEEVPGEVVVSVGQLLGGDLALVVERVDDIRDAGATE